MLSKKFHGTSIVLDDNGVLIIGDSGSGKSDLALRLIDNGATLISDDVTICEKKLNGIFLSCPKEIKGLLEVREVGIITVPYVEKVKLILVVRLTDESLKILNFSIPLLSIDGKNPSAVVKVKVKLNEVREEI
jgi:serine kinase of HPr protein (carbohydrate metabolism regulator)